MGQSGNFEKTKKTKFKKHREYESDEMFRSKPKHHDKSYYRLLKQERRENEF